MTYSLGTDVAEPPPRAFASHNDTSSEVHKHYPIVRSTYREVCRSNILTVCFSVETPNPVWSRRTSRRNPLIHFRCSCFLRTVDESWKCMFKFVTKANVRRCHGENYSAFSEYDLLFHFLLDCTFLSPFFRARVQWRSRVPFEGVEFLFEKSFIAQETPRIRTFRIYFLRLFTYCSRSFLSLLALAIVSCRTPCCSAYFLALHVNSPFNNRLAYAVTGEC